MESELSEHWNANLAYTRLSATYDSDFEAGGKTIGKGKHLPGVPESSLFGELVWKPVEGISMGWEGMYRSQVYVEDSNSEKAAPSYAVFNWRTRFEQRLGAWTFHRWCAWTTCSTASTSARSSSATATGVTTKRPPGCPGTREPGSNTSSEVPGALVRATRPALVSVVNSDYCMDVQ